MTGGIAFVVSMKYQAWLTDIIYIGSFIIVSDYNCSKVELNANPVHLALNADNLVLSVCTMTETNLMVALFDVRSLVRGVSVPWCFYRGFVFYPFFNWKSVFFQSPLPPP